MVRPLDDLDIHLGHNGFHRCLKARSLIPAVGIELQQERIQSEHRRHQHRPAIAILNVSRMHHDMHQQARRIDGNMPLLAFDLLAGIITMRVDAGPPFSALFTL